MSDWCSVEIYATFMRVLGEIEVTGPDRLSDSVNRFGTYLRMRDGRTEPLSVDYPVLSRPESSLTIRKASVILICPSGADSAQRSLLWKAKRTQTLAMTTEAFSLVGDIHLDARMTLEDQLERCPGDFVPITNLSALWVAAPSRETPSLRRPFGLLNPATILSFAER